MDKAVMNLRLQQWKPIFEAQAESGLNKEEWCKQNGIRRWEFYKRQRKLRQSILDQASDNLLPENVTTDLIPSSETFVELPMKSEKAKHGAASVESDIGALEISYGKFKIKLKGSVEESVLETVIKAVAHV